MGKYLTVIDSYVWDVDYLEKSTIKALIEASPCYDKKKSLEEIMKGIREKDQETIKNIDKVRTRCQEARTEIQTEIKPKLEKRINEEISTLAKESTSATNRLKNNCIREITKLKTDLLDLKSNGEFQKNGDNHKDIEK